MKQEVIIHATWDEIKAMVEMHLKENDELVDSVTIDKLIIDGGIPVSVSGESTDSAQPEQPDVGTTLIESELLLLLERSNMVEYLEESLRKQGFANRIPENVNEVCLNVLRDVSVDFTEVERNLFTEYVYSPDWKKFIMMWMSFENEVHTKL